MNKLLMFLMTVQILIQMGSRIFGHIVGSRNYIASLAGAKENFGHPEYTGGKDNSYDQDKPYLEFSVLIET